MLAVWRWDRYGGGRTLGLPAWIGPVALGLACSIKQGPWFCVPFLMVGVALEARRAGRSPFRCGARYGATVVAVFAAVNLPFIIWNPSSWLHGTLTPFIEPLVADGQGLVSLATHGIVRGVDLTDLTVCGALVYLTVLAVFVTTYPLLKRAWLVAVRTGHVLLTAQSVELSGRLPPRGLPGRRVGGGRRASTAAGGRNGPDTLAADPGGPLLGARPRGGGRRRPRLFRCAARTDGARRRKRGRWHDHDRHHPVVTQPDGVPGGAARPRHDGILLLGRVLAARGTALWSRSPLTARKR